MIRQNLHAHTVFDDGRNTPREMAEAAFAAGFTSFGFSFHSVLPFENDWCLTDESMPDYLAAVEDVRAAFDGRMKVYSGIEWDLLSEQDASSFDYVIGSIHHLAWKGLCFSVDDTPQATRYMYETIFDGDAEAMQAAYFRQYLDLARKPWVDIVGHFDLITKFSEVDPIFDEDSEQYLSCALEGMDALVRADKIFEVNTGAMGRGWRTSPYPSRRFLRELKARNARVCVSSDCHSADAVACAFPETEELLREVGFRERWELSESSFVPVGL